MSSSQQPTSYGVVLFPGFQALDVFGPLDILNQLARTHPMRLSLLSTTLSPISTKAALASTTTASDFDQSLVPTHTFTNPPEDLEVLIVPGGFGTRDDEAMKPVVEFIRSTYPNLKYLLTVCTGSAVVAKTGVLDGRRATSNKRGFAWAASQGPKVDWVPKARWVVDGNIWTSSGISAGIDLTYAFVGQVYGEEIAEFIANCSEYERHVNSEEDRFAELWKAGQ